jgi:hypothetical protein
MSDDRSIPERQARAILERAAEIDRRAAEVVPVETLRAAAREAGIAESAFATALAEHSREGERERTVRARRRLLVGAFAGVGAAGVLLVGLALLTRLFP